MEASRTGASRTRFPISAKPQTFRKQPRKPDAWKSLIDPGQQHDVARHLVSGDETVCICSFPQRQGAVEQRFDRAGLAATTPSDLTASIPPVPLTERTAVANTTGNAAISLGARLVSSLTTARSAASCRASRNRRNSRNRRLRLRDAFETIIPNPGRCWINVASSSAYRNDRCTKSVGSDFFNSLGYKQTSRRPKSTSA